MKMKKKITISLIILAVIVAGIAIYFAQKPKEPETIKIGAILPLTGELAEFGVDEKRGMDLAIEEINSGGEINGKELSIVYEDSKSDPKIAVSALQKLIATVKPPVVFSLGSSISLALAPIIDKNKIVLVAVASTPELSGKSPYIFRNFPSATLQAQKLANLAYSELEIREIAILYINDDLGIGNKNAFVEFFTKLGGKVIFEDAFLKDGKDFRAFVSKVLTVKPQAIYVPGYGNALALLVKQLREAGYKGKILSSQEFGYPTVLNVAGNSAEGVIYSDIPYEPTSEETDVKNFVIKFKSNYGKEPTLDAVLAYDEVKIVAEIIKKVGISPLKIRNELAQLKNFKGITGYISVLPNGDIDFSVVLKTIKNGKPTIYKKLN
jgi:branched-chain amino acid transport system substrate-binding protein